MFSISDFTVQFFKNFLLREINTIDAKSIYGQVCDLKNKKFKKTKSFKMDSVLRKMQKNSYDFKIVVGFDRDR